MNDPRLPYKDATFDDELHIGSPDDDLLEKVEKLKINNAFCFVSPIFILKTGLAE